MLYCLWLYVLISFIWRNISFGQSLPLAARENSCFSAVYLKEKSNKTGHIILFMNIALFIMAVNNLKPLNGDTWFKVFWLRSDFFIKSFRGNSLTWAVWGESVNKVEWFYGLLDGGKVKGFRQKVQETWSLMNGRNDANLILLSHWTADVARKQKLMGHIFKFQF